MDALARLDEYLQRISEGTDTPEKPRFEITTKEQAIWALRKIAAVERARKEAQDASNAEICRINEWLNDEELRANQARKHLDYLLEQYHRAYMTDNPKAKTIKLPHGTLKIRAQKPQFNRDDAAIKEWATDNMPEILVPQEYKLNWAGLKETLAIKDGVAIIADTGEVVPGVEVEERPDKFSVEVLL